jgi:hypothetical protein
MRLAELPLTANGKVDRKVLPAPTGARPDLDGAFVAPSSHLQGQLVDIWRNVLEVGKVGIRDNFFDLGGTSLSLVQIQRQVRALGFDLPLIDLFRYPTIEMLAARLGAPPEAVRGLRGVQARAARQRSALSTDLPRE